MQRSGTTGNVADCRPVGSSRRRPVRLQRFAAIAVALSTAIAVAACSDDEPLRTPEGAPISTSTTRIAEVNLVTPGRDYTDTCLPVTAPDAGRSDVTRIAVTDPTLLDAVCALGIGPKVVAVTVAPGAIPTYLGPQLNSVPQIGTNPDAAALRGAAPDVVLTSPATAAVAQRFIGVRAASIEPGAWQDRFQAVADALGRTDSGVRLLRQFANRANSVGRFADAAHTWVSLVRFTDEKKEQIAGTASFAGQVLAMIGAQRPPAQRGAESFTVTDQNFRAADGDVIYVGFDGRNGLEHGKQVLLSDRWLDLGAPTWKRVLAVDDEVWFRTSGLAAAWLILYDVRNSLANGSSANY